MYYSHLWRVRNLAVDNFRVDSEEHAQEEVNCFRSGRQSRQQVSDEGRPARGEVDDEGERKELRCFVAEEAARVCRTLALQKKNRLKYFKTSSHE